MYTGNWVIRKVLILQKSSHIGEIQKPPQKIDSSCLRRGLELHLGSTTSRAFGTTNHHRHIIDYLESHLFSKYRQGLETQICAN